MRIGIYDTNLIKQMTRKGKPENYNKVIAWLHDRDFVDYDTSLVLLTQGGVTEFLGLGTLKMEIEKEYVEEKFERIRQNKKDGEEISKVKAEIVTHLENKIRADGVYSKEKLTALYEREMGYVDPTLHKFARGIIESKITDDANRELIINRVALDLLQRIEWPADIKIEMHSSNINDLHDSHRYKVTYNTARSVGELLRDFIERTTIPALRRDKKKIEKGEETLPAGRIPLDDQIKNMETLKGKFYFKPNGDIVDTEAIHHAVVGRYDEHDELIPILFCTCDPIESILYRLLMFKWVYVLTHGIRVKDEAAKPLMKQGRIVIFDLAILNAEYVIDVEKIPDSVDFLHTQKIEDWLEQTKAGFKV